MLVFSFPRFFTLPRDHPEIRIILKDRARVCRAKRRAIDRGRLAEFLDQRSIELDIDASASRAGIVDRSSRQA
jgi:hypothetical protein